jgi:hypothetical protein
VKKFIQQQAKGDKVNEQVLKIRASLLGILFVSSVYCSKRETTNDKPSPSVGTQNPAPKSENVLAAPAATPTSVPTQLIDFPAPEFSKFTDPQNSFASVNKIYALQASSAQPAILRIAFRVPTQLPALLGSETFCNADGIAEENLSQVQAEVWNSDTNTLIVDAQVNSIKLTQSIAGGAANAEKLCSMVWPYAAPTTMDRKSWESVLYNGTNVPSGDSSDPLVRSLILNGLSATPQGSLAALISKRFLFKRMGLWRLEVSLKISGTVQKIADCLRVPDFVSETESCENR